MCGITGIIDASGGSIRNDLERMTRSLAHRGPDGEGFWLSEEAGLGHRRLAIIDLTDGAAQPMLSRDGRWVLTYNGEIYNFKELREELRRQGMTFHTHSDTEVVLQALMYWGTDAIRRFNGMFALALWDNSSRSLTLARDRYGIKPLYYAFQGQRFYFASEAKAILSLARFDRRLDTEALYEYMTFQNIFSDRTLDASVKIVEAGHIVRVCRKDAWHFAAKRYWDFHFAESKSGDGDGEILEELDRLLRQAVTRQLVSDVEIAGYLSGGLDSSSVSAIAAAGLTHMKSFTCGFDLSSASGLELSFDERPQAERVSALLGTELYEVVLKSGDMERALEAVVWHLDEPRVGQSYPNFYIARLASKFVKVVLSGTGGDELFAGYPWRYKVGTPQSGFAAFADDYYESWQRLLTSDEINQLFSPISVDIDPERPRQIFKKILSDSNLGGSSTNERINMGLYLEAKTFLHGLLHVEDKLSMAHGLETRVPFLDNDLVDFAMRIPLHLKLRGRSDEAIVDENTVGNKVESFFEKSRDGKLILRELSKRYVPDSIGGSVKQGFSAPDATWFRGQSVDFVMSVLASSETLLFDVFDRQTVQRLVKDHVEGKRNRRLLLWSLISMEMWLRQWNRL